MKWCRLIGLLKYISKSDQVLSMSNIQYWKVNLKINWKHFQQRHFTLSLFLPYHFKEIKETESRVTEFVCSGGDGNKDQEPQYKCPGHFLNLLLTFPLDYFLFFRFVFSAEEGVKVRAGSDWVWDAQFVTWQEPDSAAWPWTQPQHKHKHNFTITHTAKYANIDLNIRSTGFAV